jgi:hypothetical protein
MDYKHQMQETEKAYRDGQKAVKALKQNREALDDYFWQQNLRQHEEAVAESRRIYGYGHGYASPEAVPIRIKSDTDCTLF